MTILPLGSLQAVQIGTFSIIDAKWDPISRGCRFHTSLFMSLLEKASCNHRSRLHFHTLRVGWSAVVHVLSGTQLSSSRLFLYATAFTQIGSTESVADAVTFAYIFMKVKHLSRKIFWLLLIVASGFGSCASGTDDLYIDSLFSITESWVWNVCDRRRRSGSWFPGLLDMLWANEASSQIELLPYFLWRVCFRMAVSRAFLPTMPC